MMLEIFIKTIIITKLYKILNFHLYNLKLLINCSISIIYVQFCIFSPETIVYASPIDLLPEGITLKQIILKDSTVLTPEQVDLVAKEYIGQNITFEDLREIQLRLNLLYHQSGYTTSLVQFLTKDNGLLESGEGVIVYRALEVSLEQVQIEGLSNLRENYIRDWLLPYATTPLNINRLETGLLLLQESELIEKIESNLVAGSRPSQNILKIRLIEAPIWRIAIEGSNEENPAVGEWGTKVLLENLSLFGGGEGARLEFKQTEGLSRFLTIASIPLHSSNSLFQLSYQQVDSKIIREPFASLDIRNESSTIAASFSQTLVKNPQEKLSLGLSLEQRQSRSFLFNNRPFSFSPEVRDGQTDLTTFRFSQSYLTRNQNEVISFNSKLSYGDSNLVGLTDFFSWQGTFQYLRSLQDNLRLSVRLAGQFSPEQLPTLEKCAIGGLNGNQFIFGNTVRGYTTNLRSGDNCWAASVEVWAILFNDYHWGTISLLPFADFGGVWDNQGNIESPDTLISAGLGLRWQIEDILSLRIDYGIPLNSVPNSELTEQRWNFSLFLGTSF